MRMEKYSSIPSKIIKVGKGEVGRNVMRARVLVHITPDDGSVNAQPAVENTFSENTIKYKSNG